MIEMALAAESAIEQTEAYKTLLAQVGRRSSKNPRRVAGAPRARAACPPTSGRCGSRRWTPLLRRLEAIKRDELRIDGRPGGGRVLGAYSTRRRTLECPALRHGHRSDRPDRGAVRLPGLPQEFAGDLQARPDRARRPARQTTLAQAGAQGAGVRLAPERRAPGLGPDPPLDGHRRLARARRHGFSSPTRVVAREPRRPRGAGSASVSTAPSSSSSHSRTIPRNAWRWSRTCSSFCSGNSGAARHDPALRALLAVERDRLRQPRQGGSLPSRAQDGASRA